MLGEKLCGSTLTCSKIADKPEWGAFPGGIVDRKLPTNSGDTSLIPGLGRSHMQWSK